MIVTNQNYEDKSNDEYDFYLLVLAGCTTVVIVTSHKEKESCRTSFHIEYKFIMDVLNGHKSRRFEQFIIEKHVFINLFETLTKRYD